MAGRAEQELEQPTQPVEMQLEKQKPPPAYSVDDALKNVRQLPLMLDFHTKR
jgi:hypothetical protein